MFSRKVQARCLFSLFAGLLSSLGFAPVSFWPVTIMGIMALMAAADGVRCRPEIFCVGWAFGFGQSALSLHWLAQAFQYQTSLPSWTGGAAVLVLAGYLALYPALALTFAKWVARDGATFRMLAFPAAWVLAEWSRGWLFTGFAWNPLGVIWIDVPIIAEIAGWVGATGLSGLTVALGLVPAIRSAPPLLPRAADCGSGFRCDCSAPCFGHQIGRDPGEDRAAEHRPGRKMADRPFAAPSANTSDLVRPAARGRTSAANFLAGSGNHRRD